MNAPNGRLSGDGSVQAPRHGGHSGPVTPQIFFVSIKFCWGQKNLFETYDKNKSIFPKYVGVPCQQICLFQRLGITGCMVFCTRSQHCTDWARKSV